MLELFQDYVVCELRSSMTAKSRDRMPSTMGAKDASYLYKRKLIVNNEKMIRIWLV